LWSFASPARDRPPFSPPPVSFAIQLANLIHWLRHDPPPPGERQTEDRIVREIEAEEREPS
jgi:hypothetical protein